MTPQAIDRLAEAIVDALEHREPLRRARQGVASPAGWRTPPGGGLAALVASAIVARLGGGGDDELPLDRIEI